MSITCIAAWALALVMQPLIVLLHVTATRQQAARRMSGYGWSQLRIADHLGC